ncbi:MAG: shikimate dehydrogenase [Prevotella sp.]|nr:shikimate dehydrogenase [Prevotella sp.]MCM1075089.1 shikimate dehydrogenase [Ruminococcus sp.]
MVIYGLIGKKLGHSFSAQFFNDKFTREGIDACYKNFELSVPSDLHCLISSTPNLMGLNVTIPYKQAYMQTLDAIEEEAASIGAINTIKIERRAGKPFLTGYNTDAYGFEQGLQLLCRNELPDRALILGGTGGAAAAVIYVLRKRGVSCTIVSRWPDAKRSGEIPRITYSKISQDILSSHRLIINCTPLGTWPNIETKPDIPYQYLTPSHYIYDLVYNPERTSFMEAAATHGAKTINGLPMLHAQALMAYSIWTNKQS